MDFSNDNKGFKPRPLVERVRDLRESRKGLVEILSDKDRLQRIPPEVRRKYQRQVDRSIEHEIMLLTSTHEEMMEWHRHDKPYPLSDEEMMSASDLTSYALPENTPD